MSEREINALIIDFGKYVDEKIATETKEESRAALVRMGILDESGEFTEEFGSLVNNV